MTSGMVSCVLLCWGVDFVGLVILASSPYSSELLVPGGGWSAYLAKKLYKPEDGRYRPKHVVLLCYKYHHLVLYKCLTSPRGLGIYIRLFSKEVVET